jgi:hypothetical protein
MYSKIELAWYDEYRESRMSMDDFLERKLRGVRTNLNSQAGLVQRGVLTDRTMIEILYVANAGFRGQEVTFRNLRNGELRTASIKDLRQDRTIAHANRKARG